MEFTYEEYGQIIEQCRRRGFEICSYHNYKDYSKPVILRHDIDMMLEKAVEMAKYEKGCGVKSTYFILTTTDFYNTNSKASVEMIHEIQSLGHEIGLHFDEKKYVSCPSEWNQNHVVMAITKEKKLLEMMLGDVSIQTVSMHTPSEKTLEADLHIPGMVNSYAKEFFKGFKYVSDSYHRWRDNVWEAIDGDSPRLHILTHPFWYHDQYVGRAEAFRGFIEDSRARCYDMIEQSVLPPNVSLEECFNEDADGQAGRTR